MKRPSADGLGWLCALVLSLVTVAVMAFEWYLVSVVNTDPLWDLAVYRGAVTQWLHGGDVYDYRLMYPTRIGGFPFTYPPFAALLLVPTAWVPVAVLDSLWTLATLALMAAMAAFLVFRAPRTSRTWLGTTPKPTRLICFSAAATLSLLLTLPGVNNLALGQVSFAVAAMLLVDIGGGVSSRFRGALSGLAAAIKLTPLIAVPYFMITRQWRAAILSASVFAVATVAAFVVNWRGSVGFWTAWIFDVTRVGDPATVQNKSVLGMLARLGIEGPPRTSYWLLMASVAGIAGLIHARRQYVAGQPVAAVLIVGAAAVAMSPVSWPHHQVWAVLIAIWLLLIRNPGFMVLGAALLLMNIVGSPLIGQEIIPVGLNDPLILRLGRELPTLSFVAVCLLGLPLRALGETRSWPRRTTVGA